METQQDTQQDPDLKLNLIESNIKCPDHNHDIQMTSSVLSMTSSLSSPVDSGVQLLDSESEMTSIMSTSGIGCDLEPAPGSNPDEEFSKKDLTKDDHENGSLEDVGRNHFEGFKNLYIKNHKEEFEKGGGGNDEKLLMPDFLGKVMTKSDIANHNIQIAEKKILHTHSTPNNKFVIDHFSTFKTLNTDVVDLDTVTCNANKIGKSNANHCDTDLMNVSLNSYELLDYTIQNSDPLQLEAKSQPVDEMHVSMSEEVNESLKISLLAKQKLNELDVILQKPIEIPADEQIVFRRQRRKKSKSDTPKKRVSFHEDILNSTKIDDIHINHGFITHEPDISLSFFQRGFIRKPDVVKGRYSWAAEGDTPYYQKNMPERAVKSDIYIHRGRFSSISSSSSASISSSVDEEDTGTSNSDDMICKNQCTQKVPKSSCLKKSKSNPKYLDTNIVQEEFTMPKRKSETNLLDTNIFGSLKSMFHFSSSVPLGERGVPEGQEDVPAHSSSQDLSIRRSPRCSITESLLPKSYEHFGVPLKTVQKIDSFTPEFTKTNLKLTKSEGFYPNYPTNQNLPANIILCDSNVYEHKGISYSYEYEKFQKSFERQKKPKSSTLYQKLFNDLNFFKHKEKNEIEREAKENYERSAVSTPSRDASEENKSSKSMEKSVIVDFSDNETVSSDFTEVSHTRHLNSPKRRISRSNHYSVHSMKLDNNCDDKSDLDSQISSAKSLQNLRSSTSKTSLINRFLRNVTLKKMLDLKLQKKRKFNHMPLYVKGAKADVRKSRELDRQIEAEIMLGRGVQCTDEGFDSHMVNHLRMEIFRDANEKLLRVFAVHSAYTTSGEDKSLIVLLTNTTIYITSQKPNSVYCNHFVLPFTELDTILIGPNAQTVHLSNYDKDMQCIITTHSAALTSELVGQLEIAIRKDVNKPNLPAVKQLGMRDMVNLRKAICKQTAVDKYEEYFHYSIINIEDCNRDDADTPLGPSKEGPLMFKTLDTDTRWETAYFILKAGILYMLSSPSHRLPLRVLPLINGACQGARRVYNCTRPHTFQVQVEATTLHLAAPDEYVASEWLQALVHAASKTYNSREKTVTQACSLLMTSEHILTVREAFPCSLSSSLHLKDIHQPIKGGQALSCAAIADITAFKIPCAEQSWCVLEFDCREVHESSGDWILYFTTNTELEKFISTLEMLWAYNNEQGECFPISTIPEIDLLSRRCVDTYQNLQNSWSQRQFNVRLV